MFTTFDFEMLATNGFGYRIVAARFGKANKTTLLSITLVLSERANDQQFPVAIVSGSGLIFYF